MSVYLLVSNFEVLTGTTNAVVDGLPWLLAALALGGVLYGLWMRSARPERYARLAQVATREEGGGGSDMAPGHTPTGSATSSASAP